MKFFRKEESQMSKCVHTEHCCVDHGCKYGEDGCPVYLGIKKQSCPCEACSYWFEDSSMKAPIPTVSEEELNKRRKKVLEQAFMEFSGRDLVKDTDKFGLSRFICPKEEKQKV